MSDTFDPELEKWKGLSAELDVEFEKFEKLVNSLPSSVDFAKTDKALQEAVEKLDQLENVQ